MNDIFGQRRLTPTSTPDEVDRFLEYNRSPAWPAGWQGWENVRAAHRRLLDRFVEHVNVPFARVPYVGDGRGVVTAGGGEKYFPSLYALIRRLRELGCKLPIECWHLGRQEMDPAMCRLLEEYGVSLVDATAHLRAAPWRSFGGWQLKPYFMLWSRFAEVLWLDADVWPARDPTFVFDAPEYLAEGAVLWPDYPSWHLGPEVFAALGVPYRGDHEAPHGDPPAWFGKPIPEGYDPPVESGQLLLNKTRRWAALRLAGFFCEHDDYYFLHKGGPLHGDKETFRLAFRKLGLDYALPRIFPGWDTHSMIQHWFDGVPLFYHRTMGKLKLSGHYTPSHIKDETRMLQITSDLAERWSGEPWKNAYPTPLEAALAADLSRRPVTLTAAGRETAPHLAEDGTIRPAGDGEAFWSVFCDRGRTLLALRDQGGRLAAVLPLDEDGVYRGRRLRDGAAVDLRSGEPAPDVPPVTPIPTGPGSGTRLGVVLPVVLRTERLLELTAEAVSRVRTRYGCKVYVVLNALDLAGWDVERLRRHLAAACPAPLVVLPGRPCLSAAWNYGIVRALAEGADYLLLLANDAHLEGGAVDRLVDFGEDPANGRVAVWSGVSDAMDSAEPVSPGADFNCAMLRRRTVARHGWFDQNFVPAYFEDNDYYRRVLYGRDRCLRVHAARFVHHGSSTKRHDPRADAAVNLAWPKLQEYFFLKWGVGVIEATDEEILAHRRSPYGAGSTPLWWWRGLDESGLPAPDAVRGK